MSWRVCVVQSGTLCREAQCPEHGVFCVECFFSTSLSPQDPYCALASLVYKAAKVISLALIGQWSTIQWQSCPMKVMEIYYIIIRKVPGLVCVAILPCPVRMLEDYLTEWRDFTSLALFPSLLLHCAASSVSFQMISSSFASIKV